MRTIPEAHTRKMARPIAPELTDFETGQSTIYNSYIYYKGEYEKVEKLLDTLLNEQIQQLEKLLIEAKQVKLHLASISEEDISEEDTTD